MGTPARTSVIIKPELTSLTARASSIYLKKRARIRKDHHGEADGLTHFNGSSHWIHRNTSGTLAIDTKNPAYAINTRLETAEIKIAEPRSDIAAARRRFQSVRAMLNSIKINKNLKNRSA